MPNTPKHVAIIMDGNRRWARLRGLPADAGHGEGIKAVRRVLNAAPQLGIKILTLYAFSTENWKRPKKEIDVLTGFLGYYLDNECETLLKNGVKLNAIGKIEDFSEVLQDKINRVKELTAKNTRLILNVALNYGGRNDILEAVRRIAVLVRTRRMEPKDISENTFSDYLYTKGIPDPELIIRTSGEMRLSNFLLWQSSYSELYVTRQLWPDFGKAGLKKALRAYENRKRRLGA